MTLKQCCADEGKRNLRKHRDVATCDGCGQLLLAYGDETTFQLTVDELEAKKVNCQTGHRDALWIVSKER